VLSDIASGEAGGAGSGSRGRAGSLRLVTPGAAAAYEIEQRVKDRTVIGRLARRQVRLDQRELASDRSLRSAPGSPHIFPIGLVHSGHAKRLLRSSQMQASNRCKLRTSRAAVVSVAEKPRLDFGRYDLERRARANVDEVSKRLN
jgi:hypothetical protein